MLINLEGWNKWTGVFTVKNTGVYSIDATFHFNNKNINDIYMFIINNNTLRKYLCVSDTIDFTTYTLIRYRKVEKLNAGDTIFFRADDDNSKYELHFSGNKQTMIIVDLLNTTNHYSLQDVNGSEGRWFAPSTLQLPLAGVYGILGKLSETGRNGDYLENNQNNVDNRLEFMGVVYLGDKVLI